MSVTFYDILGLDPNDNDRDAAAAALWPNKVLSLTPGINTADDSLNFVKMLQQGLTFKSVRPGVDPQATLGSGVPGQITFAAELHVTGDGFLTSLPFYLRSLPDLGIQLLPTGPPAQCFFAVDGRGYEVLIDHLPVRLFLKRGLATTLTLAPETVGQFTNGNVDGFAYTLQDDSQPSTIDAVVRLHLTPAGDVILEPTVPLSLGASRFMGLPAKAVYDIQLIPSPNRRDLFEWARNDIGSFDSNPPVKGAVGFRSIEIDFDQPPFKDLRERVQQGGVNLDNIELVFEDVVLPLAVHFLPLPSHGTFGFRRKIVDRDDLANAYSLLDAPILVPIRKGDKPLWLSVERLLIASGTPPTVELQASLLWETKSGRPIGTTFGIDDDWTVFAGMVFDAETRLRFTIAGTTVVVAGFRFGVSVGRLKRGVAFKDSFEALVDLGVKTAPKPALGERIDQVFRLESLTGQPLSLVLRGIGWKFGHPQLEGLQMPDGVQLVFVETVRIIVEEMGWVEEPNGAQYFSFSGGVALGFSGGDAPKPSGDPQDGKSKDGVGLRVRRLRFRTNDDSTQPTFKLDGLFLNLHFGTVLIQGFGYIRDDQDAEWAVHEWGFGVKVQFNATGMTFLVAAELVKGTRQQIADPTNKFDYFLASLLLGYLPAGPYSLYDIRLLLAENMAPNLTDEFHDGQGMALLKWHQNPNNALTMPRNRTLAGWIAERDALSFGVGCGFSLNSCGNAARIDLFIFFAKNKKETGLLVVGELFVLKNPKPIAFVAVDYDIDREKFGVMTGVDLTLSAFVYPPASLEWLKVSLSGTLYFGNQPWSVAVGQLADQRSWLSLGANWEIWGLKAGFRLGVCIQWVDGGPKGFGVLFTAGASADWGIGSFALWGSFGFIVGTWKTGSDTAGAEAWLGFGFKINLFAVFSFGADISVRLTYLHGHSWYLTAAAEVRIDTPWFLPDVTFHFAKTWSEPKAFETSTLTLSLAAASALEPGRKSATALLIPSLSNNQPADPRQLYRFNDLTGISGKRVGDTRETVIPTISTDATIAIDFAQPLANDAAIATPTYDGSTDAGVQRVQDLTVRYALLSIAVRSSPLLGAGAGVWSDLVKESDTRFSLAGGAPQNLTFAWDVDARADGKLAPKRLLLNCESPYSFVGAATRNDEEAFRNDLGYPCCDPVSLQRLAPRPHSLSFSERALWSRAPADGKFSGNGARWHWMQRPTPLIAPGEPSFPGSRVARFSPPAAALVGLVDLPEPAVRAQITVAWDAQAVELFFEGYSGLELAAHQEVILFPAGKIVLVLEVPPTSLGLTRLVLRTQLYTALPAPRPTVPQATADQPSGDGDHLPAPSVAVLDVSYVGLADTLAAAAAAQQCKNGGAPGPPTSDAKGKLAFLPNHDYEVVVTTAIELSTKAQGRRSLELSQAFYFRTAGPPGLNAVPNTGDDLRHHVESTYPPTPALLVYRQEPVALAFTEGMSTVLPIDRAPKPGIVPERAQMLRLQLNVDRIASLDGLQRLTVPSEDWIEVHRPRTSSSKPHTYLAELFTEAKVRRAASLDPLVLRHEAVKAASTACGALQTEHTSQVLLHEPLDADENPGSWEAQTGYRAIVRQKDGPFIARSTFDASALGAFLQKTFPGVAPRQFSVDGAGNLVAPAAGLLPYFAVCGEAGWDHLQVQTRIDLRGARFAGIAIGVGVAAAGVVRGIVAAVVADGSGGQLILRSLLYPNTDVVIGRAALTVSGPVTLTVIAFDDKVRATVGDVTVEAQRPVREGQVALVAAGPAAFAGFRVDALDMFTFDFKTSRYLSFAEHIGSYDGHLGVLASGAFGGSPATIAGVLAAHGGEIAPLMSAAADPQERQKLFAKIVGTLGIGLRKAPISLALARLIDASGTYGFLLESCEPIALTREVTVQLVEHGLRFVQDRSGPFGGLGGHFEPFEEPVPLTPLTNGDETAALLLSRNGAPMESGFYRLKFVLDRRRWRASDTTDPEHVYHQEQSIELTVLPADPPSP